MSAELRRGPMTVMSYPGVMRAGMQVTQAFQEAGLLIRHDTTVAFLPGALPDRVLMATLRTVAGPGGAALLGRRRIDGVPHQLVHRMPGLELVRIAARRLGVGDVIGDRLWEL